MKQDESLDRLERLARLVGESALRDCRAARKEATTIRSYWAASDKLEAAKFAASQEPQDSKTLENLRQATEVFGHARQEFQRLAADRIKKRTRR